jgi:hypothetical protein
MLRKFRLLGVFLALAVMASACGDSGGTVGVNDGDPMTQEESAAVIAELMAVFSGISPSVAGPVAAPQDDIHINESYSESGSCTMGGEVALSGNVNGTVDNVTFAFDMEFDFTETITDCGVQHGDVLFVVNGADNIRWSGRMTYDGDQTFGGSFTMIGGIAFTTSDDRAGRCGIDLNMNFSTGQASGQLCGVSFDQTMEF